jgi:hypothetical protein
MAHPYYHALSSARKFGGVWQDYIKIHNWFDETKQVVPDIRHRAMRHHAEGIFLCEQVFGVTFKRESDGKMLPTRLIGEQHVKEDFGGRIPTMVEWLQAMEIQPWMGRGAIPLSKEFENDPVPETN